LGIQTKAAWPFPQLQKPALFGVRLRFNGIEHVQRGGRFFLPLFWRRRSACPIVNIDREFSCLTEARIFSPSSPH
jgi:hypothetical protein